MEHKNSKIRYALKQIKKSSIETLFAANGEKFMELEVLDVLTRQGLPHVLKTVDSFEEDGEI